MFQSHEGTVETLCDFPRVFRFLETIGSINLKTSTGKSFTAEAAESSDKRVIVFRQRGREYARAYECCWGHYYNCNRTRIGMYCSVLDPVVCHDSTQKVTDGA